MEDTKTNLQRVKSAPDHQSKTEYETKDGKKRIASIVHTSKRLGLEVRESVPADSAKNEKAAAKTGRGE